MTAQQQYQNTALFMQLSGAIGIRIDIKRVYLNQVKIVNYSCYNDLKIMRKDSYLREDETMKVQNKIVVIGAGAIGSLVGGLLSRAGEDVTLIGRKAHVDAINKSGLIIDGTLGEMRVNVKAKERLDFKPDLVLLTVKTKILKLLHMR
jgi:tRNA A37 threonylcarbamoyladenosine dehydratase